MLLCGVGAVRSLFPLQVDIGNTEQLLRPLRQGEGKGGERNHSAPAGHRHGERV